MKFFTSTSATTIFILLSACAVSFASADEDIERRPIPTATGDEQEQVDVKHLGEAEEDEHNFIPDPTVKSNEDDEQSNKNIAPDLLGAIQIGFANCDTKTQCTKYGKNSCESIYNDCNKQCVWNSSQNYCAYNSPSPRGPTRRPSPRPTRKPTKKPSTMPGSSICTRSPDYHCYKTGRPECCSHNSGIDCPSHETMCNNYPEDYSGWDYCNYSPNYSCYPDGGRPSCCDMSGGSLMNCPRTQPGCERGRYLRKQSQNDKKN